MLTLKAAHFLVRFYHKISGNLIEHRNHNKTSPSKNLLTLIAAHFLFQKIYRKELKKLAHTNSGTFFVK